MISKPSKKQATRSIKNRSFAIPKRVGHGNETYVTMNYASKFTINPGSLGSAAWQQYRMGSIFDPDFTNITGTQPLGHDEYAALFEKYLVYAVNYKVVITGSTVDQLITCCGLGDTSNVDTDITRVIEQGQYDWKVNGIRSGGDNQCTFSGTIDLPKAHGVTRQQYFSDNVYRSGFGTNPIEDQFLNIGVAALNTSADPGNIECFIFLTYRCKLMGNVLTPRS